MIGCSNRNHNLINLLSAGDIMLSYISVKQIISADNCSNRFGSMIIAVNFWPGPGFVYTWWHVCGCVSIYLSAVPSFRPGPFGWH